MLALPSTVGSKKNPSFNGEARAARLPPTSTCGPTMWHKQTCAHVCMHTAKYTHTSSACRCTVCGTVCSCRQACRLAPHRRPSGRGIAAGKQPQTCPSMLRTACFRTHQPTTQTCAPLLTASSTWAETLSTAAAVIRGPVVVSGLSPLPSRSFCTLRATMSGIRRAGAQDNVCGVRDADPHDDVCGISSADAQGKCAFQTRSPHRLGACTCSS